MIAKRFSAVWLLACIAAIACYAEIYTPETGNRVTINFGATPWKYAKANPVGASDSAYQRRNVEGHWNSPLHERFRHLYQPAERRGRRIVL